MMKIRRAETKDVNRVIALLSQVLETHAQIRPDLFIPGTTKYTPEELEAIFANDATPVYVAVDEKDEAIAHLFTQLEDIDCNNMYPVKKMYLDDLCVDKAHRGKHIGTDFMRFAVDEAKRLGCGDLVLNVWEGNDDARRIYETLGWTPRKTQLEYKL